MVETLVTRCSYFVAEIGQNNAVCEKFSQISIISLLILDELSEFVLLVRSNVSAAKSQFLSLRQLICFMRSLCVQTPVGSAFMLHSIGG